MHDIEPTAAAAPSDASILEIARQIQHAIRRPPPGDHTTWILAVAAELASTDEDRVIAALACLAAPAPQLES